MVSSAGGDSPPVAAGRQSAIGRAATAKRVEFHAPNQQSPGSLRGFASMIDVTSGSVAIVIRLVRTFLLHADIVGLILAELGELDADLGEMQARDLLVERLRQ